jgi:hypothetical protein
MRVRLTDLPANGRMGIVRETGLGPNLSTVQGVRIVGSGEQLRNLMTARSTKSADFLPGSVTVAQEILVLFVLVRIQAG